ncbi:hypothetical protein PPROV_000228700 [Pycnococcus provasolii]|uniref:EamA domain-containing protein n=3 Tax=Pycnococcus provasolii TaxID=41880 RepID=A0A830HA64_9CHLO|nr:hypothetical protein PPROV_000228700 [Pycnococcus provasolii]
MSGASASASTGALDLHVVPGGGGGGGGIPTISQLSELDQGLRSGQSSILQSAAIQPEMVPHSSGGGGGGGASSFPNGGLADDNSASRGRLQADSGMHRLLLTLLPRSLAAHLRLSKDRLDYALGLFFVLIVTFIWVASSFVVQGLQDLGISPFLLTYISNSMFVVLLPVAYLTRPRTATASLQPYASLSQFSDAASADDDSDSTPLTRDLVREGSASAAARESAAAAQAQAQAEEDSKLFRCALYVSPMWFLAQYTFNASLGLTSVSSNTILSNAAGIFTYALSVWVLKEVFDGRKAFAVLVCAIGAGLVTVSDATGGERKGDSIKGDLICLLSAFFYAAYTTSLRYFLPNDGECSMALFFGYVGLLNMLVLLPFILVASMTGYLSVDIHPYVLLGALAKGLFDNVLSDYMWARAVLLCGPTVATVSLTAQVPLSVLGEIFLGKFHFISDVLPALSMVVGTFSICGGVFAINMLNYNAL